MKLTGKPVSIGIIAGEVLKYRPFQACIRQTPLEPTEVDSALKQYDATKQAAKAELDLLEERIANEDLNYLDGLSTHESEVVIESVDRIKLIDSITNKDNTKFSYIWNEAKDEIIDDNSTYIN